jgi:hypothetical protein
MASSNDTTLFLANRSVSNLKDAASIINDLAICTMDGYQQTNSMGVRSLKPSTVKITETSTNQNWQATLTPVTSSSHETRENFLANLDRTIGMPNNGQLYWTEGNSTYNVRMTFVRLS